jgi:FkbM family methyltransferase
MASEVYFNKVSDLFRLDKEVNININGSPILFKSYHPHERQYIAKLLFDIRVPQADIDTLIFEKFVKNGDSVLDGGANIGFTALELVMAGANFVLAVEPVKDLYMRLVANCEQLNITPLNLALSSVNGFADITVSKLHNHGSTVKAEVVGMFPQIYGASHQVEATQCVTIDTLVEKYGKFQVWKLDIEGAEIDALKGALRTLKNQPPRIIIAEIYKNFLDEACHILRDTHPHIRRALIRKEDYSLALCELNNFKLPLYEQTSPMYVFSEVRLDS